MNDNDRDPEDIKLHDVPSKPKTALDIALALAEPFDPGEVHFKPAVVSGNRALAIAYTDARVIQDRLDEVLGVDGWQDEYQCLPDGSVVCRLKLRFGSEWIIKVDVGSPSEQPDGGDRTKAAFSDALKRAAVKFGVARYLYRLPSQWVDYDPQRKQFVKTPSLPGWALPKGNVAAAQPATQPANGMPHSFPRDGGELERRLQDYEARLAKDGFCVPGELIRHVVDVVSRSGRKPGYGPRMSTWGERAIALAIETVKAFEHDARRKQSTLNHLAQPPQAS
jgi:hypothetical protein